MSGRKNNSRSGTCTVPDCAKTVFSRSMCRRHYDQDYKKRKEAKSSSGLGIIMCGICDTPVANHAIGPCPKAEVSVFHISRIPKKG